MKRITAISLTVFLIVLITLLGQMEDIDSTMATKDYCERVAMYELDVELGVDDIRGHRNFKNLNCNL